MRNRPCSSHSTARNFLGNDPPKTFCKFFLFILVFLGSSLFSITQDNYTTQERDTTPERYTVNRPIRSATDELPETPKREVGIVWETDYNNARERARTTARRLLIYLYAGDDSSNDPPNDFLKRREMALEAFVQQKGDAEVRQPADELPPHRDSPSFEAACQEFNEVVLDDLSVCSSLDGYVLLKLPMDAVITTEDGTEMLILSLPGLEHMAGHPGLAVIDLARHDASYYGQVTGILPFWQAVCPTAEQVVTFLDLPPGTLSQRTLTYAVRIHPDQPLSSEGEALPFVVEAATEHALYQAERGVLGHHHFGARSRKIIDALGIGSPAEICAQSRSSESIFEGAISCMRAWRHSSAHWSIARKSHRYYGYDMAQGKNGAWYAVGFFID